MAKSKCWECYREIEANLESGKWKQANAPMKYWYEMFNAEKEFLAKKLSEIKPKSVLEIGAGSGRVIEILLKHSDAEIVALEKNKEMHELVRERFQKNNRVRIILGEETLPTGKKFYLVFCMMNTLGNQADETKLIKLALSVSDRMIFTLYKKGSEQIRKEIYKSRGHEDFALKGSCFHFNDKWVRGLISKSYSKKDIEKICNKFDCKTKISELCEIAYIIELDKTA